VRITFLGTGGSFGVPIIGCKCRVCLSTDRRNRRLRPSILVGLDEKNILIDASPDFRLQALENDLKKLDVVLFTHAHADHCLGLDELRIVADRQRRGIPILAGEDTIISLQRMFGYLFESRVWNLDEPKFVTKVIDAPFDLFGLEVMPLPVRHEDMWVFGWRLGGAAYIVDASGVPEAAEQAMKGLEVLIVNALRYEPHAKHFSVGQALELISRVEPKAAFLTHMSHELEYNDLKEELPGNVLPAYDGLVVEI
jgi:phosphoribosyl 1,2-cyclic phosphate phosphodiesterase